MSRSQLSWSQGRSSLPMRASENQNTHQHCVNKRRASCMRACVHALHRGRVLGGRRRDTPLCWPTAIKMHYFCSSCGPVLTRDSTLCPPQNAFVQLSLAFRNDNYTLEMRIKQAERERNLTEEDTEKELEEFKGSLKVRAVSGV